MSEAKQSDSTDELGLLPERANLPPQIGRLLKPGMRFGQPVYSAEQMYAYAAQAVAAERERYAPLMRTAGRVLQAFDDGYLQSDLQTLQGGLAVDELREAWGTLVPARIRGPNVGDERAGLSPV